jgi:predicted amidohydrolase
MRAEDRLSVALLQLRTPSTGEAGLAYLEPLLRRAAGRGAELILTPEFSNFMQSDPASANWRWSSALGFCWAPSS